MQNMCRCFPSLLLTTIQRHDCATQPTTASMFPRCTCKQGFQGVVHKQLATHFCRTRPPGASRRALEKLPATFSIIKDDLGCRSWGCNKWGLKGRLPSLPGNRPEKIGLFRPFPAPFWLGPRSTWKIQKMEETSFFPQISSAFLKPTSLEPLCSTPNDPSPPKIRCHEIHRALLLGSSSLPAPSVSFSLPVLLFFSFQFCGLLRLLQTCTRTFSAFSGSCCWHFCEGEEPQAQKQHHHDPGHLIISSPSLVLIHAVWGLLTNIRCSPAVFTLGRNFTMHAACVVLRWILSQLFDPDSIYSFKLTKNSG